METEETKQNQTAAHAKTASVSDMTVGSPLRQITKFALPLILGYILQQMYLVIDAAIVGRWIGVGALAAVGASSSIMFLVMGFCNGACAGFAIPVAQSFGAKDYSKMRLYVANAVRISAVMATVVTLLSLMFCRRILQMVNTPADIFHDAYIFLMLQFAAIPLTFGFNLFSGQIRALGNSRQPFYFLITSAVVNVLLDVVLILGCGLGVAGAGIATWLSQALSVILCLWYIRKHMQLLIPKGDERRFDNKRTSILLNNGVPMGLQFSITGIGIIMLQSANNSLGTTCVVRVTKGVKDAITLMLIYFIFTFALIYPFADWMMRLFVDSGEAEVVGRAAQFMRIANYFYPALGLLTILRYSIQGLGFSNLSMLSGVMEMIARCGVSLWLVPALAWTGVCLGDPVAWCMADLFLIPAFLWVQQRLKKQAKE